MKSEICVVLHHVNGPGTFQLLHLLLFVLFRQKTLILCCDIWIFHSVL